MSMYNEINYQGYWLRRCDKCQKNHAHLIAYNLILIFGCVLLHFSICFVTLLIALRQKLIERDKHLLMYQFDRKSFDSASQKNLLKIEKTLRL